MDRWRGYCIWRALLRSCRRVRVWQRFDGVLVWRQSECLSVPRSAIVGGAVPCEVDLSFFVALNDAGDRF